MDFTILVLASTFLLGSGADVLPLPPPLNVCGDGQVNIPVCSFLDEVTRNCTGDMSDIGHGRESLQLALLPRNIVSVLSEHAFITSSGISRALLAITQHFNWNRLLIVADVSNRYFLHTAHEFYKLIRPSSLEITFAQPGNSNDKINEVIDRIEKENLRVIVLSVRPSITRKFLYAASEKNWVWPHFAWIVHSTNIDETSIPTSTISLRDLRVSFRPSCSPKIINTAIYYFVKDTEFLIPNTTEIGIHIGRSKVADYDLKKRTISSVNITGPIPSDLPPEYVAFGFIILYYFCIGVCFLIVTANLVLYLYFRNEPTVKATSVPLSMLIFIGCYLLLVYLTDLIFLILPSHYKHSKVFRDGVCVVAAYLNYTSYPTVLIFSTLLVKLLRVYRLFNRFGKLNKHACSDLALAGYALILTIPTILIISVWMIADPYTDLGIFVFDDGLYYVNQDCVSAHEVNWLVGSLGYLCILAISLTLVAFSTRKIKYKNFKDTKALTSLSFISVFTITLIVSYWYIARQIGAFYLLIAILQFGDYCVILECQAFIFIPKLYPIVKNRFRGVRGKPT